MKKYIATAVTLIVLVLIVFPALKCFKQIDAGYRGIKLVWGKVASDSLPEGLYFFNPISTNIVSMDTRLQKKTTKLETYTKDIQQANIYLTVNFYVDPANAHNLYQRIGLTYHNTLIEPAVLRVTKDVIGKVEADKFVNNREVVTQEIKEKLAASLEGSHVVIQSVAIEDIAFSSAFEAAIEAKQIATQEAIKSQNETVRVEEEAKQQVIKARAESDSKKAQSDADAYAIEVESKAKAEAIRQMGLAEAEAIREKSAALAQNANLVELTKAEKWNGELPQNIYGSAPVPFLDVNYKK